MSHYNIHSAHHLDGETAASGPTAGTRQVLHTIVKGRKSWKTSRGGERVWPPELESALLEGLEQYVPDDSRETRLLGRFPLRNRFISEYILRKTGVERSAKQVGSRLQQLRDTCGGEDLLNLLSPCRKPGAPSSRQLYHRTSSHASSSSDGSSYSLPNSPTIGDMASLAGPSSWDHSPQIISIDILPESRGYHSASASASFHNSRQARPLRHIDPTVTFVASSQMAAVSLFTVTRYGQQIFRETVPLQVSPMPSRSSPEPAYLYSTTLVPGYWSAILECDDPTSYMIHQEVTLAGSLTLAYSAIFQFRYPNDAAPMSPASDCTPPNTAGLRPDPRYMDLPSSGYANSSYQRSTGYNDFQHAVEGGAWEMGMGSFTPRSDSSGSSYMGYDSRPHSVSPTAACFPSF